VPADREPIIQNRTDRRVLHAGSVHAGHGDAGRISMEKFLSLIDQIIDACTKNDRPLTEILRQCLVLGRPGYDLSIRCSPEVNSPFEQYRRRRPGPSFPSAPY
jgi:hypothetical protein